MVPEHGSRQGNFRRNHHHPEVRPANVQVTVPDLTGMTREEILAENYHKTFTITFVEGVEYKEGFEEKVYEQSLITGTKVASGSELTLTLGPKQIGMPEEPLPEE